MSEQELIDHVTVMQSLRNVVAAVGEGHIDQNAAEGNDCRYVNALTSRPVCIAACVLHNAGVPLKELKRWEIEAASAMAPGGMRVTRDPGRRDLVTVKAGRVLSFAQNYNDDGMPWGMILDHVERALPSLVRDI